MTSLVDSARSPPHPNLTLIVACYARTSYGLDRPVCAVDAVLQIALQHLVLRSAAV
jgi:hypothetical protein